MNHLATFLRRLTVLTMIGTAGCAVIPPVFAADVANRLAGLFSSSPEDELVEPDQAFMLKVSPRGPNTILAELVPAKGYYLYKDKIRFTLDGADGAAISKIILPPAETKVDQTFGKTEVYRHPLPVEITLKRQAAPTKVTLQATYQGCHEKLGVCYPPIQKSVSLALP